MTYFVSILGIISSVNGTEEKAKAFALDRSANLYRVSKGESFDQIEFWSMSTEQWIRVSEYNV